MTFKEIMEEACWDFEGGEFVSKLNYRLFYLGAFDWVYVIYHWVSRGEVYLVSAYFDLWVHVFDGLPPGMEVLAIVAMVTKAIAMFMVLNLGITVWRFIRIIGVIYELKNDSS